MADELIQPKTEQDFREQLAATPYGEKIIDFFDKYAEGYETRWSDDEILFALENNRESLSMYLMGDEKQVLLSFYLFTPLAGPELTIQLDLNTGHTLYGVDGKFPSDPTRFLDHVEKIAELKDELLGFASDEDIL